MGQGKGMSGKKKMKKLDKTGWGKGMYGEKKENVNQMWWR
jgi:hypothetical protein